ncbi:MAG: GntR family transcriptional regulator [Gemmatimonadaceae bacterium]|nr:GntR family transcriptional regulator [Gemmatimonadaceae bacterium]
MPSKNRRAAVALELRERILNQLVLGVAQVGDKLPGVRALAKEFRVNPRLISGACALLEEEGIVRRRDRSGVYITAPEEARTSQQEANLWMLDFFAQGVHRGLSPQEVARVLHNVFEAGSLRVLVVECNDDQMWSLADEVTHDFGMLADTVDLDVLRCDPSYLPDNPCDLVLTTAYHNDHVRPLARRLGVPMLGVTMCTGLFKEVARLLAEGEVHFVLSDARMERKVRRILSKAERFDRLRTHVSPRDDLDLIPKDAAVYVTRLTRARLGEDGVPGRGLPEARVLTKESVRDLMQIVLDHAMREAAIEEKASA